MAEAAVEKLETQPVPKPRFRATMRYARIAPRKLRYVADLIRGKDYNTAVAILRTCPKRGAVFCRKVLDSAMANALYLNQHPDRIQKHQEDYPLEALKELNPDALHVVDIRVNPGRFFKGWQPSSQRRPTMIKKRLCHVLFVLEERERKESRRERSKRQKQERQRAAKKPAQPTPAPKASDAPKPEQKKE